MQHLLGKKWVMLIMHALQKDVLTFNELARKLKPITNKTLSERLRDLEKEHLIQKKSLSENQIKIVYSLTQKGRELLDLFSALKHWAVTYGAVPESCMTTNCVECPYHP